MPKSRVLQLVRLYLENGLKAALVDGANVRDLLSLLGAEVVGRLDFARLRVSQTTFVQRDYRHIESDIVLEVPFRRMRGQRRRALTVYILIEHQSEPDRLIVLRVLEYVVQILKAQVRAWAQRHRSLAGIWLRPVLPVVLYTGTRPWQGIGRLVDLLEAGEHFEQVTPALAPLFLDLGTMPAEQLERTGGFFGWVLELVQQRRARPAEFAHLLGRVVRHLESMPPEEQLRWLELLSYIQVLVYHDREPSEQAGLQGVIQESVTTDRHRQEVKIMGQTIAEAIRAEGKKQGEIGALQRNLLRLLRQRFRRVPTETADTIKATEDIDRLEGWLQRVLTVESLKEMDIRPAT
jgi:hypothetical protein